MTRIADESLSDDQKDALLRARFAMLQLRYQEVATHHGRTGSAEPERDMVPETGHILKELGCALPLNKEQISFLSKSFAPALVLLKSLNHIRGRADRTEAGSPPPSHHQTLEQKFHVFVNKLSQICDYELNGKSVTACVVLQEPDRVLYLLASNDRKTRELEDMRAKLMSILTILRENIIADAADRKSDDDLSDRLLRLVLAYHKRRVDSYLLTLSKALIDCADACKRMGATVESKLASDSP
jgi:hypothetical protein